MSMADIILKCVMDCGEGDLSVLEDVEYDIEDIVNGLLDRCRRPTLNTILDNIFLKGVQELDGMLRKKKSESERRYFESGRRDNDALVATVELGFLDPMDDIHWNCNCRDTHIFFLNNGKAYRKYLAEEVEKVEKLIGFRIESCE